MGNRRGCTHESRSRGRGRGRFRGPARYLSEIDSLWALREARDELALREMFTRQRLLEDTYDTFSVDNLLSFVAPRGGWLDRIISAVWRRS